MSEDSPVPSRRELSQSLALALESVAAKVRETNFEDLIIAYDKIEADFSHSSGESLAKETRRRVAEARFYTCTDKRQPYDTCRSYLDKVAALGFTDLEKKANLYLAFIHFCREVGQIEAARSRLHELRAELDDALHSGESRVYRQILQQAEHLLRDIE